MKNKLPEGWKEVELGNQEYFKLLSSGIDKFKGEKEYLSTESVQGTKIKKTECTITYENRPSRANMQPALNSVWFAKMQATLKVYSFDEDNKDEINRYILSTGFAGIKVNEEVVSPRYLRLIIISSNFNDLKDKMCTGSTQRGINNQAIEKISLIIPPIQTQKKIVSILENAEKAKEMRTDANELTKDLLKSVFTEMFGDPGENPKDFPERNFSDLIVDTPQNGLYKHSSEYVGGNKGTPILRIDAFYNGKLEDLSKLKRLNCTKKEIDIYGLKNGEVVINRVNSLEYLGKCALIEGLKEDTVFESNMMRLQLKKEIINPVFLVKILCSEYIKSQILNRAKKAVNQASINQQDIKSLKIPLPPIELQNKFASIVKEVEQLKEQQKKSKEQIDDLFNVLMQKAFKGELEI